MKTQRRYGVELEISRQLLCVNNLDKTYGPAWNGIHNMLGQLYQSKKIARGWRLKVDTSCGGEIVSPILTGNSGMSDVAAICAGVNSIAKKYGLPAVDSECGLHIHLDSQNITPAQLSNLFTLLHSAEPIIYAMYTARNREYCAPMDVNIKLGSKLRDWTDVRDLWYRPSNNVKNRQQSYSPSFINGSSSGDMYDGTRYHGFNIHCYWRQGTVEFRYARGTTDPLEVAAYYDMCLCILNTALSVKKVDIPSSIKEMDYNSLMMHYRDGIRFRKMVKKFAKDCSLSPSTIRMIIKLIKGSNPTLLDRSVGQKTVIDAGSVYNYYFNLNGTLYDNNGRRISSNRIESFTKDSYKTEVPVELDYTLVFKNSVGIMSKSPAHVIACPIYIDRTVCSREDSLRIALGEEIELNKKVSNLLQEIQLTAGN